MDFAEYKNRILEMRRIDIVEFLAARGIEPHKIIGNSYWYHSPIRNERTPSFKVNRSMNAWHDFGTGEGGNFIDFAIVFFRCSVGELIDIIYAGAQEPPRLFDPEHFPPLPESKINVTHAVQLTSPALLQYIRSRRVDLEIAKRFCKQVHFEMSEKKYFAVGFANDAGGYELRNEFMKYSSSPKHPTTIDFGARDVVVNEGFFDFLSFLTIHRDQPLERYNYCVLNSTSMFERARPFIERHEDRLLYLDNDTTGRNLVLYARTISKQYQDHSNLYKKHEDLNHFLKSFGMPEPDHRKRGLKP